MQILKIRFHSRLSMTGLTLIVIVNVSGPVRAPVF